MTGWRMELGEDNNTTRPPLIPYSKRRRHSWLCCQWDGFWPHPSVAPAFCSLAPGCRHSREKQNSFSGILQQQCICFCIFYLVLFCNSPGWSGVYSRRREGNPGAFLVQGGAAQLLLKWSWGITCCGFLALVVRPSLSCQHLPVELLWHRITSLHFEDFFPAEISIPDERYLLGLCVLPFDRQKKSEVKIRRSGKNCLKLSLYSLPSHPFHL